MANLTYGRWKRMIEEEAYHDVPHPPDVVRIGRNRSFVTYRHSWRDVDARVWHNVSAAALRVARRLAQETGKEIEIYLSDGSLSAVVEPDAEGASS